MDILIKNMELPKEGAVDISIKADGTITSAHYCFDLPYKAVELPPHGTLKDTDAFLAEYAPKTTTIHVVIDGKTLSIEYPLKEILRPLFDAPTVLEATE